MLQYSDNAVMAKIRALYGKRLTWQDYEQLLQKKTVAEVASYLKNETYYHDNLLEVREDLVHRGQLETLIKRRTLDTYRNLMKYSYNDKLFLAMYVMRSEIEQLLLIIRLLNAGEMGHYIISLPGYLSQHMAFDLFALAKISDFDGLLTVLAHSDYYDIVGRFRPSRATKHVDITGCEAALLTYYYGKLLELVESGGYSKDTKKDLLRLLYMEIDFHNLSVIYRMKRFFSSGKSLAAQIERTRACMLPINGAVSAKTYDALLTAGDMQEFFALVQGIRPIRSAFFEQSADTGHLVCQTYRVRQQLSQRVFRFSIKPVVVVISYMRLLDIEINNLTNIIEGIRYSVKPEEIRSLLSVV